MKRFIAMSLIIMTTVLCLTTVNAESSNPFTDINSSDWYYDVVIRANSLGIMTGTETDKFEPNTTITREMFITALERMSYITVANVEKENFTDVKWDGWYNSSITWACNMGITNGESETVFGIGKPVTREQMATFIYRLLNNDYLSAMLQESESATSKFNDTPSKYAVEAVELMRKSGIIQGVGNNNFEPKANATRAQAAAVLCRLYDAIDKATFKFTLNDNKIKSINLRQQTRDEKTGEYPKVKSITVPADVKLEIEYINNIKISSVKRLKAPSDEPATGWMYDIQFLNSDGKVLFSFELVKENTEVKDGFELNMHRFETDSFNKYIQLLLLDR